MPSRHRIGLAAAWLRAGGVVAYPTEAVYGIGCVPFDADAVARVVAIKGRSAAKGLILIAARLEQLEPWVELPEGPVGADILSTWPGPVTWILPAKGHVPDLLTGGRATLAVRVTAHATASALCDRTGSALVSTSANRSGHRPARSALATRRQFGPMLDFILAGPLGDSPRPTTIRDGATGRVLRAG